MIDRMSLLDRMANTASVALVICVLILGLGCQKDREGQPSANATADIGLPRQPTPEEEDQLNKAWVEADVGEKDLRSILGQTCYNDRTEFVACVRGVQSVVSAASKDFAFGPLKILLIPRYQLFESVVQTFGSLHLQKVRAQISGTDSSLRELYESLRSSLRAFNYETGLLADKKDVNFSDVATKILELAKAKWGDHSEAYTFRHFMDGYLPVKDWISSAEPVAYFEWRLKHSSNRSLQWGDVIFVNNSVLVKYVPRGSPAEASGLRQGDRIVSFNGRSMTEGGLGGITSQNILQIQSDSVEVDLERLDGSRLKAKVLYSDWKNSTASSELVVHKGKPFRVLRLASFMSDEACASLKRELLKDKASDVFGYILDLRNNRGGLMSEELCVAGLFLGGNKIAGFMRSLSSTEQIGQITSESLEAETKKPTTLPLVVLVNGRSASASEGLAGALRDHSRAVLVGSRTFGKGSTNVPTYWDPPKNKVYIWKTGGIFYFPKGKTPNRVGIQPDFLVPWRTGADPSEDFSVTSEFIDSNFTQPENGVVEPIDLERNTRISRCIDHPWMLAEEKRLFGTTEGSDLPQLYAREALRCMNETNPMM